MVLPLLTTKLDIPPVRLRLVSRPRLIERLIAGMHRKLTLLSAPAGFGKSTLLSEWAPVCGRPVAWLSLDESDNDPTRFLAYLIAALQRIEPGFGKGALNKLEAPQPPSIPSLLEDLINDLAAASSPFVLILDDYHRIEAKPIHDALSFLLDHQPLQMHLVISTRIDPPLPIALLRGRGQLTDLRQNDLGFTLEEAGEFLNKAMGLQLSTDEVTALASHTEGWIAGLQMAAVSLQGRDDSASFVQSFAGSHRHVLDYLMEEVFIQQSTTVQTFLLQTAVLDRLTGPLCDAVLGEGKCSPIAPVSSQEILEYLDRTNLFVVALDAERRWYRYHKLLSDLLRQRLEQSQPDSVHRLHQRASTWYEQQGLMAAATEHALSAKDFERALRLVEQGAKSVVMHSEIATLHRWLEHLPDDLVHTSPILCVLHAWALLLSGSAVEVAEARLQDAVDADPDGHLAGEVLAVRALMATCQRKTRQGAELSRRALELLPEDGLLFRSLVAGCQGYSALNSGDLVAARQAFEETVRLSQPVGNLMNAALALCHLGDVAILEGHVGEGKAFYEQALTLAVDDQGQREPIAGLALIGLGRLLWLQHDLEEAGRYLQDGIELIKLWGEAGAISGYAALAQVRREQGDMEGAREAIQAGERLAAKFSAIEASNEHVANEKACLMLALGNTQAVSRWIADCDLNGEVNLYRAQDGNETVPFNRLMGYTIAARLHITQARPDEAVQVLRPLRQMAETAGWTLYVAKLLILESLALYTQGNISEALGCLASALALSEPEGWVQLFVEEGASMIELLRHAASRGIAPKYASDLLGHFETEPSVSLSSHLSTPGTNIQPLAEPLTQRELDVLRLLATHLSTPEIADSLFIAVSTVRCHSKNIYAKLNVHRRSEAAERAKELKLI